MPRFGREGRRTGKRNEGFLEIEASAERGAEASVDAAAGAGVGAVESLEEGTLAERSPGAVIKGGAEI